MASAKLGRRAGARSKTADVMLSPKKTQTSSPPRERSCTSTSSRKRPHSNTSGERPVTTMRTHRCPAKSMACARLRTGLPWMERAVRQAPSAPFVESADVSIR
jgi:hypothetical protein